MKKSKWTAQWKLLGVILAIGLLGATAWWFELGSYLQESLLKTLDWIDSLGWVGPIVFVFFYAVLTVLLIPGSIVTLGAGFMFGVLEGTAYVSVASILGATGAFLIGRYFARGWVAKKVERNPKFKAVDEAVAEEGWKIVALTRLSPVFPFVFLNYAFGLTRVSLKGYFFASWVFMLPGTLMYVYAGHLAENVATLGAGESPSWQTWTIRVIGFVATLAVTVYVTRIARRALAKRVESDPGAEASQEGTV